MSIPPLSEAVVLVRIEGVRDSVQWGMLEPSEADEKGFNVDGVLIGRTLMDMQKETIPF